MLTIDQLSDLGSAQKDIENKKLILDTAIDIQALLRLLVSKGIITKEEMNQFRQEVKESPKYRNSILYIEQTLTEIEHYKSDPQALLREMMRQKVNK